MDVAVVGLRKPLFGDSGPSCIANQLFEAYFVGAPSTYCSMEREAHEGDHHIACEFGLTLQVVFFELFDETTNILAFSYSQCDFVLSGSGLNSCKWVIRIRELSSNDVVF